MESVYASGFISNSSVNWTVTTRATVSIKSFPFSYENLDNLTNILTHNYIFKTDHSNGLNNKYVNKPNSQIKDRI